MTKSVDPELVKIGQAFFQHPLNGEFTLEGKKLFVRLLSTPLTQVAFISIAACFTLFVGSAITKQGWMGILGGIGLFGTIIYTMLVPIFKPNMAKSEIQVMFFAYIALVQRSLELPTEEGGQTLLDVVQNESLAQPMSVTVKTKIVKNDTQDDTGKPLEGGE